MIIDTTISAMEIRMDAFRRLDEAVERKKVPDFPRSQAKYREKKAEEEEKFEIRMEEVLARVINLFSVGRNIQKSRELSE